MCGLETRSSPPSPGATGRSVSGSTTSTSWCSQTRPTVPSGVSTPAGQSATPPQVSVAPYP